MKRPGKGSKAVITVEGLKTGTKIEVIDEDRVLTAEENRFTDNFAPLTQGREGKEHPIATWIVLPGDWQLNVNGVSQSPFSRIRAQRIGSTD